MRDDGNDQKVGFSKVYSHIFNPSSKFRKKNEKNSVLGEDKVYTQIRSIKLKNIIVPVLSRT